MKRKEERKENKVSSVRVGIQHGVGRRREQLFRIYLSYSQADAVRWEAFHPDELLTCLWKSL